MSTGYDNTYIGTHSGFTNSGGSTNTLIGFAAGYSSTGNGNVMLGHQAGYNEAGSNKLYIDNSNTSEPLIWGDFASDILAVNGNFGVGTLSPAFPMVLERKGTNASSRELKDNIKELSADEAIQALDALAPVKYNYRTDEDDEYVGFIAEDVPDLVASKDRKGMSPMDVVAVLTKVLQEQQKTIDELKAEVEKLKKESNRWRPTGVTILVIFPKKPS